LLHSRLPYRDINEAVAGEVLECVREPQDRYAVAVLKKKKQNNHWTFTTKVVQSVFVLF